MSVAALPDADSDESGTDSSGRALGQRRPHTESAKQMIDHLAVELGVTWRPGQENVEARVLRRLPVVRDTDAIARPQTRADCIPCPTCQDWRDDGVGAFLGALPCGHRFAQAIAHSRPCVRPGCRWNLSIEVSETTGHISHNFAGVEPDEVQGPSCASDIADKGGATLEEVGHAMAITRERIRQIEEHALRKIKDRGDRELGIPPARGDGFSAHGPMRGRGHGPG